MGSDMLLGGGGGGHQGHGEDDRGGGGGIDYHGDGSEGSEVAASSAEELEVVERCFREEPGR